MIIKVTIRWDISGSSRSLSPIGGLVCHRSRCVMKVPGHSRPPQAPGRDPPQQGDPAATYVRHLLPQLSSVAAQERVWELLWLRGQSPAGLRARLRTGRSVRPGPSLPRRSRRNVPPTKRSVAPPSQNLLNFIHALTVCAVSSNGPAPLLRWVRAGICPPNQFVFVTNSNLVQRFHHFFYSD